MNETASPGTLQTITTGSLFVIGITQAVSPTVAALQAKVDAAIAQLGAITQRIQMLAAENEPVRKEVAALRQQLTDRLMAQSV